MAQKIGASHGIEASRLALVGLDKAHEAAYDKLLGQPGKDYGFGAVEGTMLKLVAGHNETIDDLADLEARLSSLPFLSAQASG